MIEGAIQREAVTITNSGGHALYGVVSSPATGPTTRRVIVFCQAGLQNKSGAGDYFRWLADRLTGQGYVVLRFDPAGTGDSSSEINQDVDLDRFFVQVQSGISRQDTVDVIDWAVDRHPGSEIYLWGQCGGCISAVLACAERPGPIKGLILLATPVLFSQKLDVVRDYDARVAWQGYLDKLLRPRSYLRLLSGKSEYRLIKASVLTVLKTARKRALNSLDQIKKEPVPDHPLFNGFFWEAFQELMRAKKPILFLMASKDNETPEFDEHFKEPVLDRRPAYGALCTVQYLEQADHSLMMEDSRLESQEAILRWLRSIRS